MAGRVDWEPEELLAAVERALAKILQRFGDDVARDADGSLAVRNRPSLPGQTPSVWTDALKVVAATERGAVSIGVVPQAFRQGGGTVPAALESGGTLPSGATIAPRPFLQPALQRQLDRQMPAIWRDSVL